MPSPAQHLKSIAEDDPAKSDDELATYTPNDSDWQNVHDKVKTRDSTMLKDYDSEVDTLLVFAGLFSAILTAFIVDVYQDLKVDNEGAAVAILQRMLERMEGRAPDQLGFELPSTADPSPTVIVVITLWFISLILSLVAALFGIFIKQWLHVYSKWIDVCQAQTLQQGLVLRGFYQSSLTTWHLPDIFASLGVLLQLALVLFVVGMVAYLWTLNFIVSPIMTVLAFTMVVLSIITIFLPVFDQTCPYKFPMAYVLLKFRTGSAERDWTDYDLSLAQSRLLPENDAIEKSISQLAVLLDLLPAVIKSALRQLPPILAASRAQTDASGVETDPSGAQTNPAALQTDPSGVQTARDVRRVEVRISQLSAESTHLLIGVVTTEGVCKSHIDIRALDAHDPEDSSGCPGQPPSPSSSLDIEPTHDLYRLWFLVFPCLPFSHSITLLALRHLKDALRYPENPAFREKEHLTLLVHIVLPMCSDAGGSLEEIRDVALAVDKWATSKSHNPDWGAQAFAARISLHALKCAAECIPLTDAKETGLSPITPYLDLLDVLEARVGSARVLFATSPAGVYEPPQDAVLVESSYALWSELIATHNSYVCLRRRGFTQMDGKTDQPRTAFFSSDSKSLRIVTDEPIAWVIDVCTWETTPVLPRLPARAPLTAYRFNSARFSLSNSTMFWGSRDGPLLIMDWRDTGSIPVVAELDGAEVSRVLEVSPDGKHVIVDTATSAALMCDASTGELAVTFEGHSRHVLRAAFSPDAQRIATTSLDNTVIIWDVEAGDSVTSLHDLGTEVNAIAWSHDGSALAVTVGASVCVHDAIHGDLLNTLNGHAKLVFSAAFSPSDSTLIATGSKDRTVRIWDCTIGKKSTVACLAVLTGPNDEVNHVHFSPNGQFLACAADDGVWIWDVNPTFMKQSGGETISDAAPAHTAPAPDTPDTDARPSPTIPGARFRSVVEQIMMKARKVENSDSGRRDTTAARDRLRSRGADDGAPETALDSKQD